jgi:hypothetical protein
MKFSLLFASIFVQAVLHKEFVGAKSDKLLGGRNVIWTDCRYGGGRLAIGPRGRTGN